VYICSNKTLVFSSTFLSIICEQICSGYPIISGHDLWTSGSDAEGDDTYVWSALKLPMELSEVNWKTGEPNSAMGECVFFQFSNSSVTESKFALANCSEEKKFVCEVKLAEKYE
jgi:hypothetical protein